MQEVDLRPSIHLAFYQLKLRDLPFGLAIRPRLGEGGTDGGLVSSDATRKRRDQAHAGGSDPWIEICDEPDESLTVSITNPLGTSDEIRIPARMALIPSLENRKLGRKLHRM